MDTEERIGILLGIIISFILFLCFYNTLYNTKIINFSKNQNDPVHYKNLYLIYEKTSKGYKYGYIDNQGNRIIGPIFDYARDFSDGLAAIQYIDQTGFIDKTGKFLFDANINITSDFHNNMAIIRFFDENGMKFEDTYLDFFNGYVNRKGDTVVKPIYDDAEEFSEGLALVRNDSGKYGFIDNEGDIVIPLIYDGAESFSDGVAAVYSENKIGFIDHKGEFVIRPKFSTVPIFREGLALVNEDTDGEQITYCINKSGEKVFSLNSDNSGYFSEGLAPVKINEQWSVIDKVGKIVFTKDCDLLENFVEGMARFEENNRWGFVNKKGEVVVEPIYDEAEDFVGDLARVYINRGDEQYQYYIDKNGKVIWTNE